MRPLGLGTKALATTMRFGRCFSIALHKACVVRFALPHSKCRLRKALTNCRLQPRTPLVHVGKYNQ